VKELIERRAEHTTVPARDTEMMRTRLMGPNPDTNA
jgi:hypothetical protein